MEPLEDRRLLAVGGTVDFGDLPDNYETTLAADGAAASRRCRRFAPPPVLRTAAGSTSPPRALRAAVGAQRAAGAA